MKLLLTIKEQDIVPGAPVVDDSLFQKRYAARAVVFDDEGKVALLHVAKHGYHKLPGGGLDPGEDVQRALERELQEEIGCRAEVNAGVGIIIEHRDQFELVQTSHCFVAKQIGEKGQPSFTDTEQACGFEIVWADDLTQAVKLLENDKPNNYEGKFIQKRDLTFLRAAK